MKKLKELLENSKEKQAKDSLINLTNFNSNEADIKKAYIHIAESLINKKYIVSNADIITELLKYFTGNQCKYDLNKGIYLHGKFGVGKTILFRSIQKTLASLFPFSANGFQITSIEQIVNHYKENKSLDYFGYKKNYDSPPCHLCINEFGKSVNEKIYGTDANEIIYSLFMIRYELFQNGHLTHVTSNFGPFNLEYEPIIMDRINEMFNFIEFKGETFRK